MEIRKKDWLLVSFTLVLLIGGQICNKVAADQYTGFSLQRFINPIFLLTFLILLSRGLLWIIVLKNLPLSTAYPVLSLSYPAIMILSFVLFGESINFKNILGSILILMGVFFIAKE